MIRRHVLSALLLVVATMLVAVPAPAGAVRPDPMYGAPDVGDCYLVPIAAADKNAIRERSIDCSKRHTLWIVGAVQAPKSVEFDFSMKFWRFVVRGCSAAQNKAIGDQVHRYLRSAYQNFFFLPTQAQMDRGAHWISCELGWLVGNERLVPNTRLTPPRLSANMSDEASLCMSKYRVQCSRPHQWRAVYGQVVPGPYSDTKLEQTARRVCPDRTSTPRWNYSGGAPMGVQDFSLVCYDRTSR